MLPPSSTETSVLPVIDIHCHILPNIDDGPGRLDASLEMCRMAAEDGIKKIVATPHYKPGFYDLPTKEDIDERVRLLNDRIGVEGIDLEIIAGLEVRIMCGITRALEDNDFLTVNRNGVYVLAEFPMGELPGDWERTLDEIISAGFVPIIAHPERNHTFSDDPDLIYPALSSGAKVQLTAESITGEVGPQAQRFSEKLLKDGLVHAIASDSHSVLLRPPVLSRALEAAAKIIGMDRARKLVCELPEKILAGEPI